MVFLKIAVCSMASETHWHCARITDSSSWNDGQTVVPYVNILLVSKLEGVLSHFFLSGVGLQTSLEKSMATEQGTYCPGIAILP